MFRFSMVPCNEKNCPIRLPWDRHLGYVLSAVQNKMHPVLRQGFFFFCFCREPCKVGLTKRMESPNCGRCFLTCAQKDAQLQGCNSFNGSTRCGVRAMPMFRSRCQKVNKHFQFKRGVFLFFSSYESSWIPSSVFEDRMPRSCSP